jgi:iron complex outermembrane receptor protein
MLLGDQRRPAPISTFKFRDLLASSALAGCGILTGSALIVLAIAAPASAQAPAASPAAAPQDHPPVPSIAEIVVTAQKRAERVQDVPISISVVTPTVLASVNAKNLTELSGAVPGVQFNGNGGGGRTYLSMRGTTGSALNTGDEPVAIYMDDVYLARGVAIGTSDLLDLGSIEIVRGPQGTLQGRNATAGAILLRSADPTGSPSGYADFEVKSAGETRGDAAVSGPLGGGFKGRLAAGYVDEKGWGRNLYDGSYVGGDKSGQVRGVVTYSGDSPLTARIAADYSAISNTPAIFRNAATTFSTSPTGNLVPLATPQTPLSAAQHDAIFNHNDFMLYPDTATTVDLGGGSAKLTYALPGVDVVSVSGYRSTHVFGQNNSSGLATPPREGYNNNDDRSDEYSEEFRLQSNTTGRLSWIGGLYYFYEDQNYADTIYNLQFSTPTSTATLYKGNQKTNSYAVFGDATLKLLDNLQLIGGMRYSYDHKALGAGVQVTNTITSGVAFTPYIDSHSWASTTYRVKLVYHPMDRVMLFAGYGTGFRAGGYNDFAVQPPYAPETNDSFEAGIKADILERKLSFSLTGYSNVYKNLQLRAGVPSGGAIITNAANSDITGAEVELNATPDVFTRINFNASYNDAKFKSFPKAVDIFNNFVDASGNTLPNAPRLQFFIGGARDFPLNKGWMITADANYRWRDKIFFYFTNQNLATWQDKPGGTVNLRLSLHDSDDRWTFAAFGTNLTNARIVVTDVVTFSYPEVGLNEPRMFGVAIQRKF